MYGEKMMVEPSVKQDIHMQVAEQMSGEIMNFSPDIQNTILRSIRNIILERRQCELDELEKRFAYLKLQLQEL